MTMRQVILATLNTYQNTWCKEAANYRGKNNDEEWGAVLKFTSFVAGNPNCFIRANLDGHFTGSALVVNSTLTKVLLTHHKKLNMWLQLGGHADGNHLMNEVAMTEAHEESGLTNLEYLNYEHDLFGASISHPLPFDLDCHLIPANKNDPQHYHFDVRYLIVAQSEALPVISDESHDVRWFTIGDARDITTERSMHRQFDKVEWLKTTLKIQSDV